MKTTPLRFSLALLVAATALSGCNWDSSLYETYGRGNVVTQCPPGKLVPATETDKKSYVELKTMRCYAGRVELIGEKGETAALTRNEEDGSWQGLSCVDQNQNCLSSEGGACNRCADYIDDYRICLALQDFTDIFENGNEKMPSISFIGDFGSTNNIVYDYPDAGKYRICPSDYGKCYYHKEDKRSTSPGEFGCVSSCPSTMVECGGQCIDPKTNTAFCGASEDCAGANAGEACADGLSCVNGQCTLVCTKDQIVCNNECINPSKDDEHCGATGTCSDSDPNSPNFVGEICGNGLNCIEGKCILDCLEGQIKCPGDESIDEKFKKCVNPLNDNDYCGATAGCKGATNCKGGQVCSGTCQCPGEMVLCPQDDSTQKCVDLRYNDAHCGSCGAKCKDTEKCIDRVCVKQRCEDENETLCLNTNECVNLNDDINNCGVCGSSCGDHPMPHAEVDRCENKECKYKCIKDGDIQYTMCDGECVDTNSNPKYCRDKDPKNPCGAPCDDDEYCDNGQCKTSTCEGNECNLNGLCLNRTMACGKQCIDCTDKTIESVECNNGVCNAKICAKGYHLKLEDGYHKCVENTPDQCAPVDSTETVNCNDYIFDQGVLKDGYESASCENGACVIECKHGYYSSGLECIKADSEHCYGVNCTEKYTNSLETICNDNGLCELKKCNNNYHIIEVNGEYSCEINSNSNCGKQNVVGSYDCSTLINSNGKCNNGECGCNYYYTFVFDEVTSLPSCVQKRECDVKCYELEGWQTGDCENRVNGYNVCDAYSCQSGYHLTAKPINDDYYQGVCVINSNESCGINFIYDDHYNISCISKDSNSKCDIDTGLCKRDSDNKYYCADKHGNFDWRNYKDCRYYCYYAWRKRNECYQRHSLYRMFYYCQWVDCLVHLS